MAKVRSIMRGDDGDYIIKNGRYEYGDTTTQHQEDILLATPGQYADDPLVGVGIATYLLDDESPLSMETEIQKQFEADGMNISSNKNGIINATY